jgi:hypothetical protein
MLRRVAAALMLASAATGMPHGAACANAQAADSFEVVPRLMAPRTSHAAAWTCAIAGAGLIAASFPLSDLADRRFSAYLVETDPSAIDGRFRATVRADRMASGSLLGGEMLIVGAVWLSFVHHPRPARAGLVVLPDRCAVRLRF